MASESNQQREPLSWQTVARLRAAGSHETADIAERILRQEEAWRWWKPWTWRWLNG